jgi:hypothetical protein
MKKLTNKEIEDFVNNALKKYGVIIEDTNQIKVINNRIEYQIKQKYTNKPIGTIVKCLLV